MNRKGFTLVELLAVIVIISLLTLLTSTAVTKLVKDSKVELSNAQVDLIKSAAETWASDNLTILPSADECRYITLGDLKKYGFMSDNMIDPNTSQEISDDLKIKIFTSVSSYAKEIINYEVDPESVEGCTQVYKVICKAANDVATLNKPPYQGYNSGDAYDCEVKEDTWYRFYILSVEGNYVNMIAQQNITSTGEFTSEHQAKTMWSYKEDVYINDNQLGPRTAYTYLNTATNNWTNIPVIKSFSYLDEGNQNNSNYGYQSIITQLDKSGSDYITTISSGLYNYYKLYENMRARLPYVSEIIQNTSCKIYSTENDTGSCPLWILNYLYTLQDDEEIDIGYNLGYWTLSSKSGSEDYALGVYTEGYIRDWPIGSSDFGIRPVITVEKNNIIHTIVE